MAQTQAPNNQLHRVEFSHELERTVSLRRTFWLSFCLDPCRSIFSFRTLSSWPVASNPFESTHTSHKESMATRREKCQGINHGICASDPLCSGNAMYFHGQSIFNLWRDLDMGRELGQRPTRKHPHDWAWCCAPLEICLSATTETSPAMKPAHQFRTNNASVDKFIFWPEITYFVHPTILVGRFSSIIQPFQKGNLSFVVLYGDIIWHIRLVVRFFARFHRTWNNDTKGFKSTCPFPWPLSFSKGGSLCRQSLGLAETASGAAS